MSYEPDVAAAFYDAYGEREWTRFEDGSTPPSSVATHTHYLERFVHEDDRVLEIGCGPGRFTLELVRLGARVVAADISTVQLDLHRRRVADDRLEARVVADVLDLSRWADASFDAAVCYGGPLSYVMDEAPRGVAELVRVTRPGGHVLLSVMSLVGATIWSPGGIGALVELYGEQVVRRVTASGVLTPELGAHGLLMRLYRWSELRALLTPHGRVVAASAAGMFGRDSADPDLLAELELDLGAEPGAVGVGHHILAVLEVA
jgi:SAM-dependent methyltransferase